MIKVDQKETLRRCYFIKRHSIRQIAEEFHRSRKTVRKAIADGSVPQYRLAAPKPSPVMGPYLDKVREWMEADKSRPVNPDLSGPTAFIPIVGIYERLVNECGFTGAERTVCEHVSKLRPRLNEMAIPLAGC